LIRAAVVAASLLAGVALPSAAETADEYPSRPLHLISPFPPGGATDVLGRIIGEGLSRRLGQPVVVENLPTIDESGLKGFDNSAWTAMGAPAGTPRPIVEKLNRELTAILDSPSMKQKIAAMGADVIGGTPEQFSDYLKTEIAKFARIVREGRLSVR
jgi:tripartite-type tricarboxylate transporter receptor subunit TctC